MNSPFSNPRRYSHRRNGPGCLLTAVILACGIVIGVIACQVGGFFQPCPVVVNEWRDVMPRHTPSVEAAPDATPFVQVPTEYKP